MKIIDHARDDEEFTGLDEGELVDFICGRDILDLALEEDEDLATEIRQDVVRFVAQGTGHSAGLALTIVKED